MADPIWLPRESPGVAKPPRLVELEEAARSRLMTHAEIEEMRDLGAAVRADIDQVQAALREMEDGTER